MGRPPGRPSRRRGRRRPRRSGLPRESRISRASTTSMIVLTVRASTPAGRSRSTVTPGSSRPSRNSSDAPPPVEIWVIRSASPCWVTAATESPPPTTTVAPASARSASIRATAFVPWANEGISKTPSGPFQNTVSTSARASRMFCWLSLPRSTMCHEAGIFSARSVLYSVPRVTSLATMTSTGRTTRTPLFAADERIRRASSTRSGSARLLPMALPWASRNVFAMPPPRISRSTLVRRWSMTLILSETLAPPRIAANGRSGRLEELREHLDLALHEQSCVGRQQLARCRPSTRGRDGPSRRRR